MAREITAPGANAMFAEIRSLVLDFQNRTAFVVVDRTDKVTFGASSVDVQFHGEDFDDLVTAAVQPGGADVYDAVQKAVWDILQDRRPAEVGGGPGRTFKDKPSPRRPVRR